MDAKSPEIHAYSRVFVVYGRKPLQDEIKREVPPQAAQLLSPPSSPLRTAPMTRVNHNINEATKDIDECTGESSSGSEESCSDMDSTWVRRRQKALIEHIMRALCQHLDSKILRHAGNDRNGDGGSSSALQEGSISATTTAGSSALGMERYTSGGDDSRGGDGDENDGDDRRRKSRIPAETGEERPRYACPYYKRDPGKYGKWRSCPGPGWDEVHRVK
jgi:hypothetical protein